MNRRDFLKSGVAGGAAALATGAILSNQADGQTHMSAEREESLYKNGPFEWEEATVVDLSRAMRLGELTAVGITKHYLQRIHDLDQRGPKVNSVIEMNPEAVEIARALDRERKGKGPRGPMHGIPVLIKDNIATRDKMQTTAGSLALVGALPPNDSSVAARLRLAGAVILGKTNLSEWANIRSTHSTSGWSGRGGLTRNPYALDRNPSGSSSGSGAAASANFCAVAIGTETDGSIVSPSTLCGLVGMKPTVGLVSQFGIIPISHTQDTAGPMTRCVADAAILLGALAGRDDIQAVDGAGPIMPNYTQFLNAAALKGARLGVARRFFGTNATTDKVMEEALAALKAQGAELIDPADLPRHDGMGENEELVLSYELKADLNKYLAWLGPSAPVKTLAEIIDFNERNKEREMPWFGQEFFLKAQACGPLTDKKYLDALEANKRLAGPEGIDALMDKMNLDAIIAPTGGPAAVTDLLWGDRDVGGCSEPAARAGYPHITVPAGMVNGLPVGISFFGRAWSEGKLLGLAFAFEQATKARRAPKFLASIGA